ncbi:MAG: ABC transporter ATP-binding protein/permease [Clostridiales bacterium]|nr:ABC transporter ATP-binding protein/permease [Clostridiales bacterium]
MSKRSSYSIWGNTAFMIANAWKVGKGILVICVAAAAAEALISVAELLLAPMILSKVEEAAPLEELVATIAGFSLVLLVLSALKGWLGPNMELSRLRVRKHLMDQINEKMSRTSYSNLLDTDFRNFESRASRACFNNVAPAEVFWVTWKEILVNVFGFLAYSILLSSLHPLIMLLIVLTAIAAWFVNRRILRWGYLHREEAAACDERMNYLHTAGTDRQYAKDIRIFGLYPWLQQLWEGTMRLYRAFLTKREKRYLLTNMVDVILILARNGVAYGYLIWLTLEQGLAASEFLLYFTAITGFASWVTGILDQFSKLYRESQELTVVREFLDWKEPFRFEDGKHLDGVEGEACELRLEHVSYRYPGAEKDTLTDLDLVIHPGEKLAIVGVNGAGKTTIVRLLSGLLDPTAGRVLLNGQDIRQYNRREYYQLFAAVFQDFSVLETSIKVNVAQRMEDIDEKRVWECLEMAGLTEKIQSLPDQLDTKIGKTVYLDGVELSGGQTQRLMLARAMYKKAPVLMLDEPTAALDPIAENDIYLKYEEMTRGKTSLFISHRLASTRFCDRILFLEHGRVTEEGTHESLLELGGGYADLYNTQKQYYEENREGIA